jgi:hypothetical protein
LSTVVAEVVGRGAAAVSNVLSGLTGTTKKRSR